VVDEEIFFNRVIPDENKIREKMIREIQPMSLNDEDALDELISKQMKEIAPVQNQH